MPAAIRVQNLGKSYRVSHEGRRAGYRTLRESLVSAPAAMMRRMRNGLNGGGAEEFWALKDVDLEIDPGEVVGIIGHNGAGKSTLLKILSRITRPTTGRVELRGRVGSLLEVGTGFHPELTGRENIFLNGSILGMSRREIVRRFDEIVDFAEVERFLDTPVKRYSSGMYVRLAFAVAAHLEPEILLVDEVLAVGDAQFQKKCLSKMEGIASGGRTIIVVSHQMSLVQRISDRVAMLERGRVVAVGATETVLARYLASGSEGASPGDWIDVSKASRKGMGGARFIAARYGCPDGTTSGQPYSDGPLEVRLIIEADTIRSIDGLAVGFYDHYGTLLVNANLLFLGESIDLRRGRNEIALNIEQLHLTPDIYTADLWMAISSEGEAIDHVAPAFQVDVIDAPKASRLAYYQPHARGRGLVTCTCKFSAVP
jgi:lipopolysaccharide transport system ATP-binding protein